MPSITTTNSPEDVKLCPSCARKTAHKIPWRPADKEYPEVTFDGALFFCFSCCAVLTWHSDLAGDTLQLAAPPDLPRPVRAVVFGKLIPATIAKHLTRFMPKRSGRRAS